MYTNTQQTDIYEKNCQKKKKIKQFERNPQKNIYISNFLLFMQDSFLYSLRAVYGPGSGGLGIKQGFPLKVIHYVIFISSV